MATGAIHKVVTVSPPEAMRWSKELARKEGIFVGVSAGGTFAAAMKIAEEAPQGSVILCMLPDTGERYLTTPLFGDIGADMSEEEVAILRSSPLYAEAAAPPVPASV